MAARDLVTRIVITAKDQASSVFAALQTKVAAIGIAIAGYFSAKLFGASIASARDFETAMSAVQAAAGASGDELKALRAAAEDAGATTKYTSVEAAGALENLAKAGLNATDAVKALPAVLDLASAGGVSLGEASEFITKAVAGMGLAFTDAARVADVLAMGANASNTSVTGLAQALSYAAPTAQSLGLSLEQTVAIIGKFADAGIDAGRAGTALNSILAQFSDPASKFRRELGAAGVTTTDFDQALRQLAAAGPRGQKAIQAVGQEAGPALRALLNQGIDSLDELKVKLDESAGSARTFADVMNDNLDGATKGLGSAWDALLTKLGTPVLEPLKNQINALADRFRAFVADGTAEAWGEAIASAFRAAIAWINDFTSRIDFTAVGASLREFATVAADVFRRIGKNATTAGNVVQLAYGVMSAGSSAVVTSWNTSVRALFKMQEGVVRLASALNTALALMTFNGPRDMFTRWAADMDAIAERSAAAAKYYAEQSGESFAGIVRGADIAQRAWDDLGEAGEKTATSADNLTTATDALGKQATLTADQLDALGEGFEFVDGAVVGTITPLRTAADELKKTADESAAASDELKKIGEAFQRMGVQSQEELAALADQAKRDFETIRDSGQASAAGLKKAFESYAQSSIAANDGVADSTLRAEAAALGYEGALDKLLAAANPLSAEMTAIADAMDKTVEAAERSTKVIERKAAADVRAAQAALELAKAKGDEVEITKAQIKLAETELAASQKIAKAKQNEASAADKKVTALVAEAKADGDVSAAEQEVIDTATAAAEAKRDTADAARDKVEAEESELQKVRELSEAQEDAVETAKEVAYTASGAAVDLEKGLKVPWLTGAAAASQYADEAIEAARRIAAAMSPYVNPYEFIESYARRYIKTLEDLDRQQQRVANTSRDGLKDMQLRWLELNGTEEEVARARAEREKAEVERAIALLRLEEKRARLSGDSEKAKLIAEDIQIEREKLELLGQIHAREAAIAKERRQEEKQREEERKREDAAREKSRAAATTTQPDTARPTASTRHEVVLRMGGLSTSVNMASANDAESFTRFMQRLSDDMGRAS
jgi:TP901 family phage tail tape measure protein